MKLLSCGIDAEKIHRFEPMAAGTADQFPFVFSGTEIKHCIIQPQPAIALCVAFCAKEALRKAIGVPYNYPDFQVYYKDLCIAPITILDDKVMQEFHICKIETTLMVNPGDPGEVILVLGLFGI